MVPSVVFVCVLYGLHFRQHKRAVEAHIVGDYFFDRVFVRDYSLLIMARPTHSRGVVSAKREGNAVHERRRTKVRNLRRCRARETMGRKAKIAGAKKSPTRSAIGGAVGAEAGEEVPRLEDLNIGKEYPAQQHSAANPEQGVKVRW